MDALWQRRVADTVQEASRRPVRLEELHGVLTGATKLEEAVPGPTNKRPLLERLWFFSMGRLVRIGHSRKLEELDIPPLEDDERVASSVEVFQAGLARGQRVLPALMALGGSDLRRSVVYALLRTMFSFVGPYVIYDFIDRLERGQDLDGGVAARLLAGFLVAPVALVSLEAWERSCLIRVAVRVRGAFSGVTFRKAVRLTPAAMGAGEGTGAIVNLINSHAHKVFQTVPQLNKAWQGLIQISVALTALIVILGGAGAAGVAMLVLLLPVYGAIAGQFHKLYASKTACTDERLKLCTEMITGIRVLKLFCWEDQTKAKVGAARSRELEFVRKFATIHAVLVAVIFLSPVLASFMTFLVYSGTGDEDLTASTAFTAMSLFVVVRIPLLDMPMVASDIMQSLVALRRLQDLLDLAEVSAVPECSQGDDVQAEARGATIAWAPDAAPVLRELSFRVARGKLTCVVGSVGAGKSSLVSALVGDLAVTAGELRASGPVVLAAQTPWIKNATLKDNVLMGGGASASRYRRALEACALLPDLAVLPAGENQEIGERGISLSGGQKQRVSLARAVCRATPEALCIFDDPLSAVDVHVGRHIFDEVLMGELRHNTRLLVTNQLWVLPHADHIIVLSDGRVATQGTYEEVMASGVPLAQLLVKAESEDSEQAETTTETEARPRAESTGVAATELADVGALTTVETRSAAVVSTFVYWAYAKALGGGAVVGGLLLLFLLTILSVSLPDWWMSTWLATDGDDMSVLVAGYAVAGLINACFLFAKGLAFARRTVGASSRLHDGLVARVLGAPMEFFDTTPTGRILNRFAADLGEVDNELGANLDVYVSLLLSILVMAAIISIILPWFVLPLLPLGLLYFNVQRYYRGASVELMKLDGVTRSPVFNHFQESLNGASTIRAMGFEAASVRESAARLDYNHAVFLTKHRVELWMLTRLGALGSLVTFFTALFVVVMQDEVDPGYVGFTLICAFSTADLMNIVTILMTVVEDKMACVERILEYSGVAQEPGDSFLESAEWKPAAGAIEFQRVQMRYRAETPLVLRDLSFAVRPGEKVGVVGRTGAGKSSLAVVLFRLVELAGGRILIDGQDIARLPLRALRAAIDIIPQDPTLFLGPLRTNVDMFGEFDDDQIWAALRLVNMADTVAAMPGKLEEPVQEGGGNLSVGQRQLLCLARALIRRPKILIMDESTASVDLETDALIQRAVRSAIGASVTTLTVAHRLHTIMDSDRVLVMDAGVAVEFDSPAALVEKAGGVFAEMVEGSGEAGVLRGLMS